MRWGVTLAVLAFGCRDAKDERLEGWWSTESEGVTTIFGFLPAEEAWLELPLETPTELPVSVVYLHDGVYAPSIQQLATYEVDGKTLLQEVIGDVNALPGTLYETRILGLRPGEELVLESTQDPSGQRTYAWHPRCPAERQTGWAAVGGTACPSMYFSGGTSLAIDARGHVHSLAGLTGEENNPSCLPVPTYAYFGQSCESMRYDATPQAAGSFDLSSMVVVGDELHALIDTADLRDQASSEQLVHRWRALDDEIWHEEVLAGIATDGGSPSQVRLLSGPDGLVALRGFTGGRIEMFRQAGGAWTEQVLEPSPGARLEGVLEDAAIGEDGTIALLSSAGTGEIVVLRGGAIEQHALPLPFSSGFGGGVAIDGSGRVHATWDYDTIGSNGDGIGGSVLDARGVYAILDGATWTTHELGPAAYPRMVTRGDGPWQVVHADGKASNPALVLLEVDEDGSLAAERLGVAASFGAGHSHQPFHRMTATRGEDGTIAATFDANDIWTRFPEPLRSRPNATVRITFASGAGRVVSEDGALDCTADCSVDVPFGTRIQVRFEPAEAGYEGLADQCSPGELSLYGWCWIDATPELGTTVDVAVTFWPEDYY